MLLENCPPSLCQPHGLSTDFRSFHSRHGQARIFLSLVCLPFLYLSHTSLISVLVSLFLLLLFRILLLFILHLFLYLSSISATFTVWHHFHIRPCISLILALFRSFFYVSLTDLSPSLCLLSSKIRPCINQKSPRRRLSRYWQINRAFFVTLLTNIGVVFCHVSGKHGFPTDPPIILSRYWQKYIVQIVTLLTSIGGNNCHVTGKCFVTLLTSARINICHVTDKYGHFHCHVIGKRMSFVVTLLTILIQIFCHVIDKRGRPNCHVNDKWESSFCHVTGKRSPCTCHVIDKRRRKLYLVTPDNKF